MSFIQKSRSTLRSALGSPATPQQVITTKGHIDRNAVRDALNNSRNHVRAARSYAGGGIMDHHAIKPHDVTVGFRYQKIGRRLLNHPNLRVLASFNGFSYQDYPTDCHIARAMMFTGVALANEYYDNSRTDSGLALQVGGVYTILNTGNRTLKPGQCVRWRPPPTYRGIAGAAPMNHIPGQSMNTGDPHGKLFPIIEPYDPRDVGMSLTGALATMFRSARYADDKSPGILGMSYRDVYNERAGPSKDMRFATHHQDEALGMKFGLMGVILQAIHHLMRAGILGAVGGGVTPAAMVKRLSGTHFGLFEENPTGVQTGNLKALMTEIFWKHSPSRKDQEATTTLYRTDFSTGFAAGGVPSNNWQSLDANIVRLFSDSIGLHARAIAGAAQEERSCIIGKQANEALPGEGATVIFGMRNN